MKGIDKNIIISELLYKSLCGDLSEDEQTLLDCWLKDEENRKVYEELLRPEMLYEEIQEMAELDTGLYYRKIQRQMAHRRWLRLWLGVASVAAVLVLLIEFIWPFRTAETVDTTTPPFEIVQSSAEHTTLKTAGGVYVLDDSIRRIVTGKTEYKPFGEQTGEYPGQTGEIKYNLLSTSSRGNIEVTLADSTKVWLNAASRLRYPNRFTGGERVVELIGEAYFEVARNEQQPFIVKTGAARIEVLGTQFNVNAKQGEPCFTTLVEGCVKVRNKLNDTMVIYPGQQVNASIDHTMLVKWVDPRFYTAWKRNRFAFQDESLYRIMQQLSEWYGCTFEFSNPRLANLHFTTILRRYNNISQVLEILQATREFGFLETGHHIYITDYGHVN